MGHAGRRIGNRRNQCDTCNNFAQNVTRLASKALRELHPEEYRAIRLRVELDLYPQVIEDHVAGHPAARRSAQEAAW
jgi:hypothetical protein